MRTRHALVTLSLAIGLLGACGNELEVSPAESASDAAAEVGASPEVQRLVAEIDSMLVVPQGDYPDGNEFSGVFDQLLDAAIKQRRTLRTHRVAQNLGYFIATGHGIGWNPQEADIERLAQDWREFRPDVLAGP
jgi:hypothetical protein